MVHFQMSPGPVYLKKRICSYDKCAQKKFDQTLKEIFILDHNYHHCYQAVVRLFLGNVEVKVFSRIQSY